jgi:cytochrome P450
MLSPGVEIDLVGPVIGNYTISVICDVLGLPAAERPAFLEATMKAFSPDGAAAIEGHNSMIDFVVDLAQERRRSPGEDVLSRVATAEVDGERLSDIDVGCFVALLLGAGAETSASTIMQGLWHLSQNRDQLDRWRADFGGLAPTAVEEMLRTGSAVTCFRRTATEDLTLHGADIAKGPLARREITIFYRKLFERFSDFDVPNPPRLAPNQRFNMVTSLKARFTD